MQDEPKRLRTKFGLGYSQSLSPTVKLPIYFVYDMDLVDLIIFTVGDPQGCWNELQVICDGSKEMRIVTTWLWSLFKMILRSQRKWSESWSQPAPCRLLRSLWHLLTAQLWQLIFVCFVSFCIKMSFLRGCKSFVAADILLVNWVLFPTPTLFVTLS